VKKTLLVAALAAILVFAAVGSAFAVADQTDQARFGARVPVVMTPGTPPVYVSGGEGDFVDGNMTGTNTYKNWLPGLLGNAQTNPLLPNYAGNSPHANYTTTTVKCVVCHAVHFAAPGNTPVAAGTQTADTLLRMRADQACAYCHATAGESVLGGPVYNGLSPAALAPARLPGNQNIGHYLGSVSCTICHTNVHGAGDDTSVASLNGLLLNTFPLTGVNGDPAGTTTNMLDAIDYLNSKAQTAGFGNALPNSTGYYLSDNSVTAREQAVGVFCAECHNGAYATGEPGASTSVRSGSSTAKFSGHRIAAAATTNWNSTGTVSSGDRTLGPVAFAAADNCKSCHDATDDYGDVAFPHAWGKSGTASSKDWLQMAPKTGATKVSVGQAASADTADYQLQDGVCLKCHVSNDGAFGIGITF
jgi:hypothetical protein